ncbi:MAG TPA: filamentous hemagglutinin N-terminal domain-containing protein, partial [Chroococcidiopsis sp.]
MTDAKVCAVLLLAVVSSASFARPSLAQSITANDDAHTLITRDGDRYIIRGGSLSRDGRNLFHSFERLGLSAGEIAEFISTPAIDNVLGRVTGGNPSVIDGLLRMTGGNSNLYLINPAGIIFGPHARLDLPASFLATTATGIGFNQNWLDAVGDNRYADLVGNPDQFYFSLAESGVITNAGYLSVPAGESLTLLGGTVVNTGTLSAAGGTITVAAVPGESRVRLTQAGTLLSLEIEPLGDGTLSEGGLRPASLPELLTGGAIATATGLTVDPDGTVRLTSTNRAIATQPGTVVISGTLDAASPTAIPEINLVGDRVMVLGANLNASGRDGGRIRIGGDYRGQGAIATATLTTVDADTTITANSLTATGEGGRIFVWADDTTRFDGTLSARGGTVAGQGGFVELSGARHLTVTGTVDLTAPNGAIGTLLLDPTDITIVNGDGGGNDAAVTADGQVLAAD